MQEAIGLDAVKKTDGQGEKTDQVKGMASLKRGSVAGPRGGQEVACPVKQEGAGANGGNAGSTMGWGSCHSCEKLVETLNKGGMISLYKKTGAGETMQGLGLAAPVETPSFFPSTHSGRLITACNSSSRKAKQVCKQM